MRNTKNKKGFTLIEVMLAVILVGLAIASLVGANGAFSQANGAGTELSTAEFLLEQIKELTAMVSYDGLDDFNDANFCPPIDAGSNPLSHFTTFTQQVTVENVNPSDFDQVVSSSNFIRITVKVLNNSEEICSSSWLRAKY